MSEQTSTLPAGQHEWEATFRHDEEDRPLPPQFQAFLVGEVTRLPTPAERDVFEAVLTGLEQSYPYGPDGLLTAVGWGSSWFENHTDEESPVGRPSKMARWEDPVIEDLDFLVHLASDDEELLTQVRRELADVFERDLHGLLKITDVRTGFVGAGIPTQRVKSVNIPESSPLLLGFRSVYKKSQAPEETLAIPDGPFAGGTTAHVSRIVLNLEQWHAKTRDDQSGLIHAPSVSAREAEVLVDDAPSDHQRAHESVEEHGVLGHTQAAARARVNDVPLINRRDFATLDDDQPGTHFISLQRDLRDFNNTRAIMNGSDVAGRHHGVGSRHRNGINSFMTVTKRATFIIPPRALRAFPQLRVGAES